MDSNDADQYARLAMDSHQRGELDQAIAYYQKLLAIKPGFAQVHYNLGIAFSALGRLDETVASDALWVGVPVLTLQRRGETAQGKSPACINVSSSD